MLSRGAQSITFTGGAIASVLSCTFFAREALSDEQHRNSHACGVSQHEVDSRMVV
jgi:hypothetical protein